MGQFNLFEGLDVIEKTNVSDDFVEAQLNVIRLKSSVVEDEYTKYVQDTFDLSTKSAAIVDIPYTLNLSKIKDWNIGVICGASGSGKSTILKHLCGGELQTTNFDNTKSVISNFDKLDAKSAARLLSAIGLASVPTWLRPYNTLSNGEKYRAELAKLISDYGNDIIFVDEYTSVVDRNVAMSMSNALQKYIRANNKKVILATCHYDIFEWLRPNWIYDLNKGGVLEEYDYLRPRPTIELQIFRTTTDTWKRFAKHHYMTNELNKSSQCFVFTWNDKVVAFYAILPFPNGSISNGVRGHRLVVLPDFQGLGLGSSISEFVASIYKSIGYTLYCKTVNPRLGEYRSSRTDKWKASSTNMKERSEKEVSKEHNIMGGLTRASYCHHYIGEATYGFEDLLLPVDVIRKNNSMKGQLTLF